LGSTWIDLVIFVLLALLINALARRLRRAHRLAAAAQRATEHARAQAGAEAERLGRVQAITDPALARLGLSELMQDLLGRLREALAAQTAVILLLDEPGETLVGAAAVGLGDEVVRKMRTRIGRGFVGRIAAERRTLILDDRAGVGLVDPALQDQGIRTLLGSPLIAERRVVGVIHTGRQTSHPFTADDERLLRVVADRAALAIERARLHE
jgi:sigma-B regulation protein RsbU (phosphoserine phosphatase)